MLEVLRCERVVKRHLVCLVMQTPGKGVMYRKQAEAVFVKEELDIWKKLVKIVGRIDFFALEPSTMMVIVLRVLEVLEVFPRLIVSCSIVSLIFLVRVASSCFKRVRLGASQGIYIRIIISDGT